VSDRGDAGWSRAAQDRAEAELWPDGRPEPERHGSVYVTIPGLHIPFLGAIVGAIVGGILGWANFRPDPNAIVDSRVLDLMFGAFVGVLIGIPVSVAVAVIWALVRRLTKRNTTRDGVV
jgi:hypothetical protein